MKLKQMRRENQHVDQMAGTVGGAPKHCPTHSSTTNNSTNMLQQWHMGAMATGF